MQIISAWKNTNNGTEPVNIQDIDAKDIKLLKKKHKEAMKAELLWSIFGGVISVNGLHCQVVE